MWCATWLESINWAPELVPVIVFQLIKLNNPDLVLFVGEALVGNEAVDQLKKFNQALADFSMAENPRLIDGILLTKFDTIDDKVSLFFWKVEMGWTLGYFRRIKRLKMWPL